MTHTSIPIETNNPLPLLQPAHYKRENYSQLTDKMFQTYKYISKKYGDYDWYLKADDDTFIFMDNLRKFLSDKNSSSPVNFGHNFKRFVRHGYESGGAGYVLSHEAMTRLGKALNSNYSFCLNTGIEDVDTGRCLRKLGVEPGYTFDEDNKQLFHPFSVQKETNRQVC
jgi:glycoprotein-N-acetylgalactosamine 3-beta-galactosyltransferase